jgi:hypothetical protein
MTHGQTYFENDQRYFYVNYIVLHLVVLQQNEINLVDTYNYGLGLMWNELTEPTSRYCPINRR